MERKDEMKNTTKICIFIGSVLYIGCLVGCARFNTFYNAQQYFNQAEKARSGSGKSKSPSSGNELYDKAIQKASKILTFHPKSKLVDDALLLMGKAFYWKGDYLKAVRKFSELIDNFPESNLVHEASFWLGTSYYAVQNYEKAEKTLTNIVTQKGTKKWAAEAQFLLAEMAFQEQRYRYALKEYGKVVERFSGSSRSADAQFRIGQCYTLLERPSEARLAYDRVFKFDPHDTLKLNATFSIGQSLREEGRYEQAIDIFKELLKDSRNIEYYSAIRLEIAECEADKGALEEAISEYEGIIEDYPKSESSAEAHYRLGLVYLNVLGDLPKAKEHLEAVKTDFGKSIYADEAQQIGKNIKALMKLYSQLLPSLRDSAASESEPESVEQGSDEELPGMTLDEVVAEISGSESLEFPEVSRELATTDTTGGPMIDSPPRQSETKGADVDTAEIHFKLAETYLLQFSNADSALEHYKVVSNRFPESEFGAKSAFAIAWVTDMIVNDPLTAQGAYLNVIESFPRTSYEKAARLTLGDTSTEGQGTSLAESQFEEAERTFLRGGDVDSLIVAYQMIIDQYPDSPYAPKASYAIAWILEYVKSDRQEAERAYQEILNAFSNTEYAKEAKIKLGMVKREKTKKAEPQRKEGKESDEGVTERELTFEDIVQEMLEEEPIIIEEPEVSSQTQPQF